jgi:hypothetical protein
MESAQRLNQQKYCEAEGNPSETRAATGGKVFFVNSRKKMSEPNTSRNL